MNNPIEVDRSDAADARRMRWILDGNGYALEEEGKSAHWTKGDEKEADETRRWIDVEIATQEAIQKDRNERRFQTKP